LLTVASSVHASHATATRAKQVSAELIAPAPTEPDTVSGSAVAPARASEQSPRQP
jgi:hypothetical protein